MALTTLRRLLGFAMRKARTSYTVRHAGKLSGAGRRGFFRHLVRPLGTQIHRGEAGGAGPSTLDLHEPALMAPSQSAVMFAARHRVAWLAGVGRLRPTLIGAHVTRTYSGRPSSSMRFSTSTAMATSAS